MADSSDSQEGPMKDIPWYPQGLCCYVLVTVSQYPGRIWCQTEVPVSYLTILVLTINDDGSEWLPWHLHFFLKSHSLRSNIPKYIQRCGGKDFQALDENSGGGGRGYGSIWPRSTENGLLFICRWCPPCVDTVGLFAVRIWHSDRDFWKGGPEE